MTADPRFKPFDCKNCPRVAGIDGTHLSALAQLCPAQVLLSGDNPSPLTQMRAQIKCSNERRGIEPPASVR